MGTKEKILIRAGELFQYMGVKNVTMDYLAADLGMSKRTIYERFRQKEQLVIETLQDMIKRENEHLLEIIDQADHVIEALFLIIAYKQHKREGQPVIFHQDIKKYLPQLQALYYTKVEDLRRYSPSFIMIEKGIKEGVFKDDLNVRLVDNFIQELIAIMHNSMRIESLKPAEGEVLYNIFLPYFRGICTPKGVLLMDAFFGKIDDKRKAV